MDVIETKDREAHTIGNDSDFVRLVDEYMGPDAARWYRERIERVDDLVNEMRPLFPPEKEMRRETKFGGPIYDLTRVAEIGKDNLVEIATIAYEIPGWDE